MDISTDQVRLWINQGIAIADRAVQALERRVEQGEDIPLFPGEYAASDEKGLKTEDEILQNHLSGLGKMLDPRSVSVEMGGEDGSVKLRATLSDEGRRQMMLKPKGDASTPAPTCDAPSCDCARGEDREANGAAETQAPLGSRETADFTRTALIDVGQSGVTLWEDPLVGSIVATNPSGSRVSIVRKGREVSLVDGPCSELVMVRYQAKIDAEPEEKIIVGVDVGKDGPTASAFHVKDGIVTPINDVPSQADWWTYDQKLAFGACFGMDALGVVPSEHAKAAIKRIQAKLLTEEANRIEEMASIVGVTVDKDGKATTIRMGEDCKVSGTAGVMPGPRHFLLTLDGNDLRVEEGSTLERAGGTPVGSVPAATLYSDLVARLDGLTAKVDALAERKGGKGKDLTVRIVKVSHAHRVSGRGLIWVVEHDDSIHPGTLVCSSNGSLGGRVMEVTGIETTSPPGQPLGLLVKPVKG